MQLEFWSITGPPCDDTETSARFLPTPDANCWKGGNRRGQITDQWRHLGAINYLPTPLAPRPHDSNNTAGRPLPGQNQYDLATAIITDGRVPYLPTPHGLSSNQGQQGGEFDKAIRNSIPGTRTSSSAGSRAKIYQLQDLGLVLPENAADCSLNSFALLESCDQSPSFWRTYQRSLVEEWMPYSGRWPKSGMMLSGIAYHVRPLVRRISATGSSYLHTATDTAEGCVGESASDLLGRFPTSKSSPSGPDHARSGRAGSGGDDLATMVAKQMWPTPNAVARGPHVGSQAGGVSEDGSFRMSEKGETWGATLQTAVAARTPAKGQLSAEWVTWLMGFPPGWTDIGTKSQPTPPE